MKQWITLMFAFNLYTLVDCIKCFECDNDHNPACGESFKSYQFEAQPCYGEPDQMKCGLQRNIYMTEKEKNFIGILRRCYNLGQLGPGINESDGCRDITIQVPQNFTFEFCFCSSDYCNASTTIVDDVRTKLLCASLYIGLWISRR